MNALRWAGIGLWPCGLVALVMACSSHGGKESAELKAAPGYVRTFAKEVTKEFDPQQILEWGQELFKQDLPAGPLPREKWPSFIQTKSGKFGHPSWISIINGKDGKNRLIQIEYAGGFGFTGIGVLPSRDTPNPGGSTRFIEWTDGVYFYYSP